MRIMRKLVTALNGGVRETAEIVIDANSLRIFAQEIHECENHITQSKQQLASIIAEKMRRQREINSAEETIKQFETRMSECLQAGNDAKALELAEHVSEKESMLSRHQQHCQHLIKDEKQLQQMLKKMITRLDNYRTELRMAQASSKMQNAQSKLVNRSHGVVSRFGDMQDSLTRIREKQQAFADEMTAMDQIDADLNGNIIDDSVSALKASASEILERVKRKTSTA